MFQLIPQLRAKSMVATNSDMLRHAVQKARRHFGAVATFSALLNALYITPTLYMLQVYDRVVPTQGLQTLLYLTLVLIFALITLSLLDRLRLRLLIRAGVKLDMIVAPALLDATLGRPDLPSARQGLRDFDTLRSTLSGPAILGLFDAPWVPVYLLVCFLVHPWIGVLAVVGCLLLPLVAFTTWRATRHKLAQAQLLASVSYASQDELLAAADGIRALGMRRALVTRQLRQREAMIATQTQASLAAGSFLTLGKFIRLALQSLALGLGALLAVDNLISTGAIFASSFLIARALQPIEQLIATWKSLIQARQQYTDIRTLLATAPAARIKTTLPPPKGKISVENLTVMNEARDGAVLQNISLAIPAGEVVAVVGPSGAGKSTLIRAIAGALLPDRGKIRLDDADAQDWDPEILARHIGYLPQDSTLLAGSIADNIARFSTEWGEDRTCLDTDVVAAASKVGADALIRRFPNGYDHQLKSGGKGISAGQAQRIALARAVFGDPAILLLDEPNAHLDTEGDAALIAALGALKAERKTVLVVSHKLGILPVVDRILVMRDGHMEMFGPRDEVLAKITPPNMRRVPAPSVAKAAS
ncbi:peptidase [Sphingobium sp. TA15]|uniref:ATP-binding cassette protein n=1 Tax=Sphingobium indicum (strain DSM 16413 / CCM 7287 / MTCC 6362 / UT26 / NBRC 101211 / UT26S) TaxID=452662 RepID=D4YYL1_SPHIU|nr:type I secretion system permease/ATPase [Sphingobium indicum]BAI95443.1 ATP-binding cassette protein [Sphingobium indicum UT26S]BDD68223.1 peptidase [Sphingobium sp. TA15]